MYNSVILLLRYDFLRLRIYSGESIRLDRAIIPYLVLFESSQLLHLFQSRYVLEQWQKVMFQVGGGGRGR